MTRELESALWTHLAYHRKAREWAELALKDGRIVSERQVHATLKKWFRKGLYDYGVALDLGWLMVGAKQPDRKAA